MVKISKTQLKKVYHRADNRITKAINNIGLPEKSTPIGHPEVKVSGEYNYENLLSAARRYDIEDFYVLQRDKKQQEARLSNRILLKGYQGIRDGIILVAKKVYKMRYDR